MEIAKLGEFGLIDRLTKDIEIKNESTKYGVGDDCAVLSYPDTQVLVTTDMLMEGVHFDLTYIDLKHLGYKSAMVNISDIFAMNGTPRQLTVSLALSKRFTVEDVELFYEGLKLACEKWGVDIVGGDTTSSYRPHLRLGRPWCSLHGFATAGAREERLLQSVAGHPEEDC